MQPKRVFAFISPPWAISSSVISTFPRAAAQGEPSWKQLQGMIRKILAERFGLQLHHEQREMPVFALRVAKGARK